MPNLSPPAAALPRTLPKQFYLKSSLFGYGHSLPDLILLAAFLAGIGLASMPLKFLCAAGIGFVGYRMTFIMHDCCHRTLFSRKWENECMGWLASSFLFTSFPSFRRLHLIHHQHYCRDLDPQGPDYNRLDPSRDRVVWHLLKPLLLFNVIQKAGNLFAIRHCGMTGSELKEHAVEVDAALVHTSVGAAVAILAAQAVVFAVSTGWFRFLWGYLFFVIPLVTLGLFLSRVRSYLEHGHVGGPAETHIIARTHRSNIVERNLLCSILFNYHFEHHRWPQVPSRFLKAVHEKYTACRIPEDQFATSYAASLRTLLWTAFHGTALK